MNEELDRIHNTHYMIPYQTHLNTLLTQIHLYHGVRTLSAFGTCNMYSLAGAFCFPLFLLSFVGSPAASADLPRSPHNAVRRCKYHAFESFVFRQRQGFNSHTRLRRDNHG